MNSKKLAVLGLILALFWATGAPTAQINMDTTYAATGARPFDEPIDPDLYLIRPGEQLEVVFIGAKLRSLSLKVNTEGRLVHAELGLFDLAGQTLTQARVTLIEVLQKVYRADQIVISVNSIYPVAIQVSGMVVRPGTYMGYTSQRVSEIIDSAGGVAPGGSTRRIKFTGGPTDVPVDLDAYRYASDKRFNPCLFSGVRIDVPLHSGSTVQMTGAVADPRSIELLPREGIADLVGLAGGLLTGADLSEARLVNDTARAITPSTPLQIGDVVVIPVSLDQASNQRIKLFGFVSRPGSYEYTEGMVLSDLLQSAGGSGSEANPERITVFREAERDGLGRRPQGRYPLLPIAAERVNSLVLKPGDSIFVPRLVGYVTLTGMINRPGLVPYTAGLTVKDYVRLVGGHVDSESEPDVLVSDRISGLTWPAFDRTVVYDGDLITVRRGEEN